MPYLIGASAFGAAFCLILFAYSFVFGEKVRLAKRVKEVVGESAVRRMRAEELSLPLYQRAIKPVIASTANFAGRFLPTPRAEDLARKIGEAGTPGNLGVGEVIMVKYLLALMLGGGLALFNGFLVEPGLRNMMMGLIGFVLGWLLPDLWLKQLASRRKEEIEKSLPNVLDLLTVSVEAGLGFDGALVKVVEKFPGALADEFIIVLQEIKMGKPRQDALRDMANRVGVDDLSSFVGSIIMSHNLGLGIGKVLRLQAEQMRRKRRQFAEEKAMKAPIKMLIPMVVFIFPAIFVVLLGPALIQILKAFSQ